MIRDLLTLAGAAAEGVRLARDIAREATARDAVSTIVTLRKTIATIEGRQQLREWLTAQAQATRGVP